MLRLLLLAAFGLGYLLPGLPSLPAADKPNIIVIMSDDMGYSDVGCYGGEIQTPHLDALAAGGLRFTQFYNTARCCPTRASLLTGLYPHQAGIGHMMEDHGADFPGYRGNLQPNCRTIAQVLKPAGYRNYAVGKWHVTRHIQPDGPKHNWPLQRGFDRFYGMISGAGSFFDPFTLCRDNQLISPMADPEYKPETYYFTDAITDQAVRYVQEHGQKQPEQPFFMYVTYTAAHWPMHALPEDMAKTKGRYDAGYEAIRQQRLQKSIALGLVTEDTQLTPSPEAWDNVQNQARELACMEVYAAMIERMDQGIGKIVGQLKKQSLLDNTLVLYLQDNGGCAELMGRNATKNRNDGPRQPSPTLPALAPETLPSAMNPVQTRDGYPVRQGPNVMPGPADTYIGYGRGWATVSNTPFREYKHWVHEGGISTPLIAHWPKGIEQPGALRRDPGHLIDIMATCVELAGATYPPEATPLEGRSLVPAFHGQAIQREAIYWEHEGNRAIRIGDWKAVAKGPLQKGKQPGAWELYDMSKDRTELNNLAKTQPERLQSMIQQWDAYAQRCQVLPAIH
ncbi:MAG: arylsulfatase [Pirellulaceae bacterium]|nr:arylsulfatase [Pirellulaceae bacterium]